MERFVVVQVLQQALDHALDQILVLNLHRNSMIGRVTIAKPVRQLHRGCHPDDRPQPQLTDIEASRPAAPLSAG
jgi:hypothetical protein